MQRLILKMTLKMVSYMKVGLFIKTEQFEKSVKIFRLSLNNMQSDFSSELLEQIQQEFDILCKQVEDKTNAIEKYQNVIDLLYKFEII